MTVIAYHVVHCPAVQEVYFPDETTFPFAAARDKALKDGESGLEVRPPDAPPSVLDLLFASDSVHASEEGGGVASEPSAAVVVPDPPAPPPIPRRFQITVRRMIDYGASPECEACASCTLRRDGSRAVAH